MSLKAEIKVLAFNNEECGSIKLVFQISEQVCIYSHAQEFEDICVVYL